MGITIISILIIIVCFELGTSLGGREAAFWRSLVTTPEPEQCAICGGERMRHHAPVLVDLAAGSVGELRVYDPDPQRPGELASIQQTGTFSLGMCAGIVTRRDTDTQTCRADLPQEQEPMKPTYFCHACRALLAGIATKGYILLDLYDLDCTQAYPIAAGQEYTIRDYTVFITQGKKSSGLSLTVQGHLSG